MLVAARVTAAVKRKGNEVAQGEASWRVGAVADLQKVKLVPFSAIPSWGGVLSVRFSAKEIGMREEDQHDAAATTSANC